MVAFSYIRTITCWFITRMITKILIYTEYIYYFAATGCILDKKKSIPNNQCSFFASQMFEKFGSLYKQMALYSSI